MATQTVTRLVDDLDGTEAVASVTFSFRGSRYEIDLNEDHIDELEQAIEPFIQYARPVGTGGPAEAPPSVAGPEQAAADTGRRRRGRPAGSRRPATKRASATKAASSRGTRTGSGSAPSGHDVRSWAKANGYEIGERGRISAEIREAYEAAVGA
ncbi:MAG TPA: Lsr2 family protein [Acidimicrobiales bacterium]|nr:Lsr2 family protein [Acidimicrobiales bacterium]